METQPAMPASPPPEEVANKLTFDKAALAAFRTAALNVMNVHPEARSVAVIIDYDEKLNDSQCDKGLWIGRNGPVNDPMAIFGSIDNTMSMLEVMVTRAGALVQRLKQHAVEASQQLMQRRQQLEQSAPQAAAGDPGGGLPRNLYPSVPVAQWPNTVFISTASNNIFAYAGGPYLGKWEGDVDEALNHKDVGYVVNCAVPKFPGGFWYSRKPVSPSEGSSPGGKP